MKNHFTAACTALLLLNLLLCSEAIAQRAPRTPSLAPDRTKTGAAVLSSFGPVSTAVRGAVVKIEVDEKEVALGAVVDVQGLIVTKASEIPNGKLMCVLGNGRRVPGKLVASDED